MDVPDFERAEYLTAEPVEVAPTSLEPTPIPHNFAFTRALTYGTFAALIGSILYAVVGLWIQVGFIAILVGGMVGTAMMNGSRGQSGRRYQVMSVLLTYFSVSLAGLLDAFWHESQRGINVISYVLHHFVLVAVLVLAGPFLELFGGLGGGLLGLLILFFGLQAAWRTAKGGPGYVHLPHRSSRPGKPLGLLD